MKTSLVLLTLALAGTAYAGQEPRPTVYLDRPGVLEGIQRDDPALHEKLTRVLELAQAQPCETLPGMLKAQFQVANVQCRSYQILTSYPPKIHFAFDLGGAVYVTNLVQPKLAGAKAMPAVETVRAK